ncbi:hypothetical protein A3K78_07215 [Candidatus Bathyarchaeota archaeon RBG_13_52_12]|nr:MAG: hypothetical protein A3K78_07215 [Candidatus Bathyarchaeota archaeon RBG_13_52_12]
MDRRTSMAAILGIVTALSLWLIMIYQSPTHTGEFAIILTLDKTKVVSDSDIQYYNVTSHEFTLTSECAERLRPMGWRLAGNFTIVVNGGVELRGIFVPPITSRSYPSSQVVIMYPSFELNSMSYRVMKIQMGYPWDQPVAIDPRDNPRIAEYFDGSGKLIR